MRGGAPAAVKRAESAASRYASFCLLSGGAHFGVEEDLGVGRAPWTLILNDTGKCLVSKIQVGLEWADMRVEPQSLGRLM